MTSDETREQHGVWKRTLAGAWGRGGEGRWSGKARKPAAQRLKPYGIYRTGTVKCVYARAGGGRGGEVP